MAIVRTPSFQVAAIRAMYGNRLVEVVENGRTLGYVTNEQGLYTGVVWDLGLIQSLHNEPQVIEQEVISDADYSVPNYYCH